MTSDKDAMEKAASDHEDMVERLHGRHYNCCYHGFEVEQSFEAGWQSALNGPAVMGLREFAENMAEIEGEIGHFARKALAAFEEMKK